MTLLPRACALLALFAVPAPPVSFAQQPQRQKPAPRASAHQAAQQHPASPADTALDALFATRSVAQAAISPDGTRVAWVEKLRAPGGAPSSHSRISITSLSPGQKTSSVSAAGSAAKAPHAEGSVAWSPDSGRIAFLSDAEKPGQLQVYVAEPGGPARKLTSVTGLLANPQWSSDSKFIAVLYTEHAKRAAGPLVAETHETGEIKDTYFEQRLSVVNVATGEFRTLSPADMYIYEYDWSPDSSRFAVIAANGNGDNNWYVAQLYTLDAAPPASMQSIYKPPLQIANPSWSPDGKRIAIIAGLMSDEGSVGGDIYAVSASGGEAVNLTPGRKSSGSWLTWIRDGRILFSEAIGGDSGISALDPASGRAELLFQDQVRLESDDQNGKLSVARDGSAAASVRSSFSSPPEVWAGRIGHWQQLTHLNDGIKPPWGEARSIHWKSDAYDVQGWLIYPAGYDPSKKYPLIVGVHGGPGSVVQSTWPSSGSFIMPLAAAGYFLLLPNPRGSFGQGEAFTRANVKDFGYGDFRDILAGVDEAIRVAPIDPHRLGITGWSYGGYMTMWAVTHTDRFRAAMAGAGLADFLSYYGENQIDQWLIPFFGASVYDDPAVYAKSSPITFIKNVRTPTLILVGDSDGECPAPQSYEFWHALRTLGVETQLVVYANEGHRFMKPADERDRTRRTLAWFDSHLR